MSNHKSAQKKERRDIERRQRNRRHRARLRTAIKTFRSALTDGDLDGARKLLPATLGLVDRSAKHGVIHGNAADRTKSRLTRALNRAAA